MRWWLRQNSRKRIHYLAPASLVTAAAATTAQTGSLPLRDLPVRGAATGPTAGTAGPIAGDAVRLRVELAVVRQCLPPWQFRGRCRCQRMYSLFLLFCLSHHRTDGQFTATGPAGPCGGRRSYWRDCWSYRRRCSATAGRTSGRAAVSAAAVPRQVTVPENVFALSTILSLFLSNKIY